MKLQLFLVLAVASYVIADEERGHHAPEIDNHEPEAGNHAQEFEYQEPGSEHHLPEFVYYEPGAEHHAPEFEHHESEADDRAHYEPRGAKRHAPEFVHHEPEFENHEPEVEHREPEDEHHEPDDRLMEWKAEYGRYPIDSIVPIEIEAPGYIQYAEPAYRYEIPLAYQYKASYDPEYFYRRFGYYPEH